MILSRQFTFLLLAAMTGLGAACSAMSDRTGGPYVDGDGGLEGDFRSEISTTQILAPNSSRKLSVRYAGDYPEGKKVEFAVLALETTDEEYDSAANLGQGTGSVTAAPGGSLSPNEVWTGDDGSASTTLTVGSTPGRFQVRARMEGLTPVIFEIEVSKAYQPQLSVTVKYDGLRPIASRSATAIPNRTCEQALQADKSSAEVRTVDAPLDALSFYLVPDETYAIVAWGRDATYAELAIGCREVKSNAPEVEAEAMQEIVVTIEDKPMRLFGSYPVELALKLDASMARLAGVTASEVQKLLPADPNAEAKAYISVVRDVLVAQDTTKAELLQAKLDGDEVNLTSLTGVLSTNKAGFVSTGSALSTLLASFGKNLAVRAEYGVGASGVPMSLNVSALVARSEDGSLAFPLMNSGSMSPTATILAEYDDTRALVELKTLSITLGVGTYGRSLLDALGKSDAAWHVARLGTAAGCAQVKDWLANDSSVRDGDAPLCDQECAAAACSQVTKSVVDAARTGYQTIDVSGSHSTLNLTGKLSAHDRLGDEAVDDLGPSPVTGNWGKGADKEDAVSGELKSLIMEGLLAL